MQPVEPQLLADTLAELALDMQFAAVHIGMLGSAGAANAIADFLSVESPPNVVLDPVLKSTSGTSLVDDDGFKVLIERLIPLATVITPNLHEASIISGLQVKTRDGMTSAAANLHQFGARNVVVTGGHLDQPADLLSSSVDSGLEQQFFESSRIDSRSTHGTGCAFSMALACHLAHGRTLADAVGRAQAYVRSAIAGAYQVGGGTGPINHFFGIKQED